MRQLLLKKSATGMKPFALIVILLIFGLTGCKSDKSASDKKGDLYSGFQNPPQEAKPTVYFTLLNGYLNKEFVQHELQEYADKGIGGLLVFDIGIIGKKEAFPPQGAEFMSDEWLENFKFIVEKCDELGMSVELAGVSSWDMGGSWTPPEEAVLALFQNSITVQGPKKFNQKLDYPELPVKAILDEEGKPVVSKEIAVLAIPVKKRQEAYEFIFKLDTKPALHDLEYVILANTDKTNKEIAGGEKIYSKNFEIQVSTTDDKNSSFRTAYKGTLKANAKEQKFNMPDGTKAKYVRLRILNGYNKKADYVQLAQFRVHNSTEERSLIDRAYNGRPGGGMEISANSQLGVEKNWRAKNINILMSERTGEVGESWISNGKQPVLIENVNDIQVITDKLDANGVLTWDIPEGEWEIIRYVMSNTGERLKIPNPKSDGYATDHLSAEATKNHINYMTERLEKKFGDLKISSVDNFYLPSYEVVGLLWTYDLVEQFKGYRNYDITKYLPALNGYIIKDEETTGRFLYDYQRTMGDLLIDAFYITANETAHERGMAIKAEAAGPGAPIHKVPVEALSAMNSIDQMQGEFWPWRENWDGLWVVKETACASHIYGEDKIVHMESFTGFRHWMDGPVDLKPSADRAFCEGMNHIVWHMAEHTPPEGGFPGAVYHAGAHFNVNLVWWNQMKPWIDYLARTSYMLQQGKFVGDIVYYYGNKGANFIQPKYTYTNFEGYDFDVTNLDVMLNRMDVKDGNIVLPDGLSYEVLVLPAQEDITVSALKKVKELAEKGATVIGMKSTKATGLFEADKNDAEVKKLASAMWGDIDGVKVTENKVGEGRIIFGKEVKTVLAEMGVTYDFSYTGEGVDLDYIHRRTANNEVYFVRNEKDSKANFKATFRVQNATPELWNPSTGEKTPVLAYEVSDKGITIDMDLDKMGSVFVVFTDGEGDYVKSITGDANIVALSGESISVEAFKNEKISVVTTDDKSLSVDVTTIPAADEVTGEWNIEFLRKNFGAPESTKTTELKSLSDFDEKGIKYYSGESKYTNTVTVDAKKLTEGNKVYLDLGDLWLTGDVTVNGQFTGNVWKAPYVIDVTKQVKAGENTLEIVIANTWSNRLIGDAKNPNDKPFCKTNIDGNETSEADAWEIVPLRKSGLFGPVKLVYSAKVEVLK
ncbi:MAG: glycosyl hydrolase [Bacteroidota bacterium]